MPQEEQTQQKPRITKVTFFLMLSCAILFDLAMGLIQLIPVAGSVIATVFNVVPLLGFFIWYKILGISFANPKRSLSFFGASLIEFIPVLNALPTWTAEVIYMYTLENADKILAVAGSVTGNAAAVSSVAGNALKFVPKAQGASQALQKTSQSLRTVQNKTEELRQQNPNRPQVKDIKTRVQQSEKSNIIEHSFRTEKNETKDSLKKAA